MCPRALVDAVRKAGNSENDGGACGYDSESRDVDPAAGSRFDAAGYDRRAGQTAASAGDGPLG